LLRDMGLATFKGYCTDYEAVNEAFYNYWGKDFLNILFNASYGLPFNGWRRKLGKFAVQSYTPLRHILLMCFLAGSVKNYVNSSPAETPFGYPPFICENRICPHYHKDGAVMTRLSDYGSGKAAHFECVYCGLKYKYAKSKYSREKRFIVDYGHLWDGELRRCCQDPKITNEKAAEILKCSYTVLQLQKKKRGLLVSVALYDLEMEPIDYYKAKVTEVCGQYEEVTIALLDEKVPGAYCYLQKHDHQWIRNRVVFDYERRFRIERKNLLLDRLREIIDKFKTEGYPDEQLSYGFIASLLGSTRDELRLHRNRSKSELHILLDSIIENRKTWRQERAVKIDKYRSERGIFLLNKLCEIIAAFESEGYPDKQLSCGYIASLAGSTVNELRYKMNHNCELQAFLDKIVEHKGTWRQERAAKNNDCASIREISIRGAMEQILADPPIQQISRNYIAQVAGLSKDVLKESPYLSKITGSIVESKLDWLKRRFITAYHSKSIESRPYSARDICRVASIDRASFKKHRGIFEEIASKLNFLQDSCLR